MAPSNQQLEPRTRQTLRLRSSLILPGAVIALSATFASFACSPPEGERTRVDTPGAGGTQMGTGGITVTPGTGGIIDIGTGEVDLDSNAFPADPILGEGIAAAEADVFADPEQFTPGSVCVFEPHLSDANGVGALYPMNWLRPRFRWTGAGTETLWEIRLTAKSQTNPLRVYTHDTQWIMPGELWEKIGKGVIDDITVTIRGTSPTGMTGMRGDFRITPALAGGSMVFWGTASSVVSQGSSRLYGFTMGDEAVTDVLGAEQVAITGVVQGNGRDLRGENQSSYVAGVEPGAPRCVGCHVSTPDGKAMAFTDDYPWNMGIGSVETGMSGALPDYVTAGAQEFMKMPFLGTAAMLPEPWATGDRTMLTTMGRRTNYIYVDYDKKPEPTVHDLVWIDLTSNFTLPAAAAVPAAPAGCTPPWADDQCYSDPRNTAMLARETALLAQKGTGWGVLYSDTAGSVSNPVASHKGMSIAYTLSESSIDGHPDWHNNTADIKILPLTGPRAAGTAAGLAGASDPNQLEYYPAFSPDDAFVAFTRAPAPTNKSRCRQGTGTPACNNSAATLGENPDGPYYNRKGEIYVVPSAGGEATRLRANDPVACSGEASPGVLNSWPKWSSKVREYKGKNYYFVIFSSARTYPGQFELAPTAYTPPIEKKSSALYMSVIEEDPATGAITSYAPIYLWNQNYLATSPTTYEDLATSNLTPAWEDFSIPAVPPVIIYK